MSNEIDLKKILKGKIFGFISSIEKMESKQKESQPSKRFGEDYNNLLGSVSVAFPALATLMPPKAEFAEFDYFGEKCTLPYNEIHTYCNQLYHMIE